MPSKLEVAYLAPTAPMDESADNPESNQESNVQTNKKSHKNKFFPGIFLTSTVARFTRPVQNLEIGGVEWIGPLE